MSRSLLTRAVRSLLVASVCLTLPGCGSDSSGSAPTTEITTRTPVTTSDAISNEDLASRLQQLATDWIHRTAPTTSPVDCANRSPDAAVSSTAPTLATACLEAPSADRFALRVQNRSTVPVTVSLFGAPLPYTVPAGSTADLAVTQPRFGQSAEFRIDTNAAITTAVISGLLGSFQSAAYAWSDCARSITAGCLVSNLSEFLPRTLEIGRLRVPLQRIGAVLGSVLEYGPLVSTLTRQGGQPVTAGRFTIVHA